MTDSPRQPLSPPRPNHGGPTTTPASPGSPPQSAARHHHPPAIDRFTLTYLHRELRGRLRQALLIALGLGLGVGLVITVTAASAGVSNAQSTVLHSLYGIGTDLTITKSSNPAAGRPDGGLQQADALQPASSGLFPSTTVTSVSRLAHVASASGALQLSQLTLSHGIPQTIPVEGVDPAHPDLGPLASDALTAGRTLRPTDRNSNVAVVDSSYAASNKLSVGSTITLGGATLHVVGIASPQNAGVTDIYIPLAAAQAIARSSDGTSLTGRVNVIYVAAGNSTLIPAVQTEITRLLSNVTVTSSSDLARQISGSLSSAATLTNDLGRWVAATTLVAAFAVASLLTIAAVTRRVRELGTLKALGWSSKRIITQVMSESLAIGVIGATIGIALGFAGASLVDVIAPKLSATVPESSGASNTTTIAVRLAAHVSLTAVAAATVLALAGALIAGSIGAWRATRLQPASAFAEVQ
ncbi:MAG TPA: ABC transporter permease [Streptosporangiaceae bacterium]